MPCAVIPQTTLTHCSTKTSTFAPFVVKIYVYKLQLHFTCSCTAVARAQRIRGGRGDALYKSTVDIDIDT